MTWACLIHGTASSRVFTASVSKPSTAVAVFKLVELGRVDLDHAAKDYCPALSPLNGSPTVRQFRTVAWVDFGRDSASASLLRPIPSGRNR